MGGEQILSDTIHNRIENMDVEIKSGKVKIQMSIGGSLSFRVYKELMGNGTENRYFTVSRPESLRKAKVRQSGVSHELVFGVCSALLIDHDGKARTEDVVHADGVQAEETQVRKALDALEQKGFIRYERAGREAYWIVEDWNSLFTYSNSNDLEKEFNPYQDKMRWCRENL